ncbi:MAG TPA: adenylate/guanylate cyclase domain-containing protein [Chthoniobacterales bacterium]|jgi:TolB-like protein/class 3 adenylate cyclase|nr:adenylate/guanylate cyclase domain-containing protein [Chthoniobacterales bacterium]
MPLLFVEKSAKEKPLMPTESTEERKLAAIMFTDMVGYSAMAQRDDKVALELLEEHRRLLRGIFPRFHGTEIKTIGDAFLVEFGSALEAAQCAIEIQRALAKRNTDVAADRHIAIKIGIHIGDVIHRDGDVYGDGVNIASRIEALAGAGGICVSMDVERQIRNALEARFEKFGSADLKNIKLPMELFRIVLPWESGVKAQRPGASTKSRLPLVISAAALLALALLAAWWWTRSSAKQPSLAADARSTSPAKAPDQKSVAVLPFVNLSDDKGSEYFSDGVSEELLTVLQKIPEMHVAARTSAFSFKGKNATAQEIGQKLGVAHLVEGSVRKAGDMVRIAARLTRADTGEELWSENYTRNLKDVFAVQSELAQTIVEQLRGRFGAADVGSTAKEKIEAEVKAAQKGGTKNVEAHELYLHGRFYENRHSDKNTRDALAAYQRAVELDPRFALAWAGVAGTNIWLAGFSSEGGQKKFDARLVAGRDAVSRALAIEPDLPEALYDQAWIETNFDFNWKAAAQTVSKLLALAPADPNVLIAAANLKTSLGNSDRGIELLRKAVELDPVNAQGRSYLAFGLAASKQFEEARAEYARVVELNPSAPWAHAGLGLAYLLQNKFEEAATEAQADAGEWARLLIVSCARWAQKRVQESDAAVNQLIKDAGEVAAYQIAETYAYRGENDKAFEWLERARRQRDPGLAGSHKDPLLENLHADSRWNAFLHNMGLADDQLKTIAP